MMRPTGTPVRVNLIRLAIGLSLLVGAVLDFQLAPRNHLTVLYLLPILVAATTLSPRDVRVTAAVAIALDVTSAYYSGLALEISLLGVVAVSFTALLAVVLADQKERTARRTREVEVARAELAESEAQYRAIFATSLHAVLVADEEGRYLDANCCKPW